MHKFFTVFFSFLFAVNAFSQQKMFLNDQSSIEATEMWSFLSDSYTYAGALNVQIGNNGNGGTLLLEVETSDPTFYIGGTVYLFLNDGNVITCTDKNLRSTSGKKVKAYYILTKSEISLLKKNKLTDVRFRIFGKENQFSSPTGFFTAKNELFSLGSKDKSHDTILAINQLFK